MATSPAVDVAVGFTVTFPVGQFTGQLISVKPPGQSVEVIEASYQNQNADVSHLNKIKIPGDIVDNTDMVLGFHFNPDINATPLAPAVGTVETEIILTHPAGATWTFPGFVSGYEPADMALDEKMMCELTVTVTGPFTLVDAS